MTKIKKLTFAGVTNFFAGTGFRRKKTHIGSNFHIMYASKLETKLGKLEQTVKNSRTGKAHGMF